MPWRKRFDPGFSMDEKGQRAYEVCIIPTRLTQRGRMLISYACRSGVGPSGCAGPQLKRQRSQRSHAAADSSGHSHCLLAEMDTEMADNSGPGGFEYRGRLIVRSRSGTDLRIGSQRCMA